MARRVIVYLLILSLILLPDAEGAGGALVGTALNPDALSRPFQRKGFYSQGLYWVFYCDGSQMLYSTSPDGLSWSDPSSVRACDKGNRFSVWFDGVFLHYAYASGESGSPILYRRGRPGSDGRVIWSGAEQVALVGSLGTRYLEPVISVCSSGHPWIGYRRIDREGRRYPCVTRSSRSDGLWETSSGFPYDLESWSAFYWVVIPVSLGSGRMALVYTSHGHFIRIKTWDGVSWRPRARSGDLEHTEKAVTGNLLSALGVGDEVHIVFLETDMIRHTVYSYGKNSFGKEMVLQWGLSEETAPLLSVDVAGDFHLSSWIQIPSRDTGI